MSHIPVVGGKSARVRLYVIFVFSSLIILGVTMVMPFMITVSSSATNDFDYNRFSPLPRYFFSPEDQFVKGLVKYFNSYREWSRQFSANIPNLPKHWQNWMAIGQDLENVNELADRYLNAEKKDINRWRLIASDYAQFSWHYPIDDTVSAVQNIQAVEYLQFRYEKLWKKQNPGSNVSGSQLRRNALELLNSTWGVPFKSFYNISFRTEMNYPTDFQTWFPPVGNPKYDDFLRVKAAYKAQMFTPGVKKSWLNYIEHKGVHYQSANEVFPIDDKSSQSLLALWEEFSAKNCPASMTIPYAMRAAWYKYLESEEALKVAGFRDEEIFTVETYNKLADTAYRCIEETPFPIPEDTAYGMHKLWINFVQNRYPLRLMSIKVTPQTQRNYASFLEKEIKHIRIANELLGTDCRNWSDFQLTEKAPTGVSDIIDNNRGIWMNFVKSLPVEQKILSSSEIEYQKFLLDKYGSLENINKTYGCNLLKIEEAFPAFDKAYYMTFSRHQMAFTLQPILSNYRIIGEFLTGNSKAIQVTIILIILTIFMTLTVNPVAAYALSRFNMRGRDKIIMYMLVTMAFPAMVSAIPAYLLMRDMGLLNTFLALLLPHAANGMSIFILKGFFDSLPQELFEAATIDGASELKIFRIVAMPLVKPILAISCMNAFIGAYNSWQWALTICQDKDMWTIAVWLYQASEWWKDMPWLVSAGFVVASIPTLLVFLACQKIILRGIVIPSMK